MDIKSYVLLRWKAVTWLPPRLQGQSLGINSTTSNDWQTWSKLEMKLVLGVWVLLCKRCNLWGVPLGGMFVNKCTLPSVTDICLSVFEKQQDHKFIQIIQITFMRKEWTENHPIHPEMSGWLALIINKACFVAAFCCYSHFPSSVDLCYHCNLAPRVALVA